MCCFDVQLRSLDRCKISVKKSDSGIMNALFDRLTYDTNGYFAHHSQMLRSSQKSSAFYMLYHRIKCINCMCYLEIYFYQVAMEKTDICNASFRSPIRPTGKQLSTPFHPRNN